MKQSALLKLSPIQLIGLWEELVTAYHGVNRYGSDTAEIYAYRFQWHAPAAGQNEIGPNVSQLTLQIHAADALVELCHLFQESHDCIIYVEGAFPKRWRGIIGVTFDHRAHVQVVRK